MSICYDRQNHRVLSGNKLSACIKSLSESLIQKLSLEISSKGSFGSLEISFMHRDIYRDIFYDSEKLKQKKLDNNADLIYYGTFVQEVIVKIFKYIITKTVLKKKMLLNNNN